MKAVSNTTPLRYLIAIEQQHLLGQLFEKVSRRGARRIDRCENAGTRAALRLVSALLV
jgi:predicted nucleic acid-binding protein